MRLGVKISMEGEKVKIKSVLFKNSTSLLGKSLKVYLKNRADDNAAFYFKCTGAGTDYITGYDEDSINLRIDITDIDFILGV